MSNTTPEYVFVYGTLKRGYVNHRLLAGCEYVCKGYARGFALIDLGQFPAMVAARSEPIDFAEGEIYKLPDKAHRRHAMIDSLDALEGEGRMYRRIKLEIDTQKGGPIECITYIFLLGLRSEFIPGGCWDNALLKGRVNV